MDEDDIKELDMLCEILKELLPELVEELSVNDSEENMTLQDDDQHTKLIH